MDILQQDNGSNDELHIVVIDDSGKIYWNNKVRFLKSLHSYQRQMMLRTPSVMQFTIKTKFQNNLIISLLESQLETETIASGYHNCIYSSKSTAQNTWSQDAQDVDFNFVGNKLYELQGGKDYSGVSTEGGYGTALGNIIGGYEIFENEAEYSVNFLLQGPWHHR